MALLDYKFTNIRQRGRWVRFTVRIYRGAVSTKPELMFGVGDEDDKTEDVTRYRRKALVTEKTFTVKAPADYTKKEFFRKLRAFANKKFQDIASSGGHTVVDYQRDTTDHESFADISN